jgi:CHAD domain-containing protein
MSAPEAKESKNSGLRHWMQRVLKQCAQVQKSFSNDSVHDLRTALRRCRSIASGIGEIDSEPAWREMRRESRKLFRRLGDLRDLHVQAEWVHKLFPAEDPPQQALLELIRSRENEARVATAAALEEFDRKQWQDWSRVLPERARRLPPNGLVAQHLALEQLEQAHAKQRRALRNRNPAAWHELRIGIKHFRYTVENFLPELYASWGKDLKHLQDLLGEVHDLDVLRETLPEAGPAFDTAAQARWNEVIDRERRSRLDEYRREMAGRSALWPIWRSELPDGARLEAAAFAKLAAWGAYLDPDVSHSRHVSRLALQLFDGLAFSGRNGPFSSARCRRLLHAAALLHSVGRSEGKKGAHKAAYRLISALAPPFGWTAEEINQVALIARYYRGAEPKEKHKSFAQLEPAEQRAVTSLSAVLRVADGLDSAHDNSVQGVAVSISGEFVLIEAAGWEETQDNAAEMGGRKHLLETVLGMPVIVRARAHISAVPASPPALEIVQRTGTHH